MKKNRISNDLMLIIMTVVFTCGVGALSMGFLPAVKLCYESTEVVLEGLKCLFMISPLCSIILIVGYGLSLAAFVVSYFGAKQKHHKTLFFVAAAMAIIGGVLILLEPILIKSGLNDLMIISVKYSVGPILGFLFSLATSMITFITGLVRN